MRCITSTWWLQCSNSCSSDQALQLLCPRDGWHVFHSTLLATGSNQVAAEHDNKRCCLPTAAQPWPCS